MIVNEVEIFESNKSYIFSIVVLLDTNFIDLDASGGLVNFPYK